MDAHAKVAPAASSSSIKVASQTRSRLQQLRTHLFENDVSEEIELQPHIQERLVKKSELWAFFLLGFGYLAMSNTATAIFQPLMVQQVARTASHLKLNPTIPCPALDADIPLGDKCVVPLGFMKVEPTSYALLVNVVAVWCTTVVSLGTSAFADHGRVSKKLLMFFCSMLAIATSFMFIGPLIPELWWVSGFLMVIALIFSGVTLNFYDAHIPILARHHPTVVRAMVKFGEDSIECNEAKVRMATFLSGGASAAGFAGGVVLTVMAAIVLMSTSASSLMIGYCLIMSAVFVLIFLMVYGLLSYQRTSPALPEGANRLTFGYVRIYKTIRQVRRLKTMFYYLCAWFILGDGLTSASNIAILLAQSQLKATNDALIEAAVLQYVSAGVSMWFWIWLQNNKGVRPLQVIIANSCLFGMIPVYCLLGLIKSNPVGLKQTWEMYMLASLFGLFVGAIYSSNRVVFSQFIPLGHENELYALFEMANVSASWIGPLICAAIIEGAGIRHTWWFLVAQFFIPAVMMVFVDVEKGRLEALEFYKVEQAEKELEKRQRQSGNKSELTGMEIASTMDSEKEHGEDV